MHRGYKLIQLLLLSALLGLASTLSIYATHNRAGEITFEQTGPLTIRATITTYTMTSSVAADRDSIEIFWGDGTMSMVPRANGWGDPQPNDIKINYYIATHTYPGRASYTLSMYDPNRIAGILNVNYPDSANVPFYLETTFSFLNTQFLGDNNSVKLLSPPIDFGCVGEIFRHNPNAYDIDGDSISYAVIIPLQQRNTTVPDYRYPDQISPGPDNAFILDTNTGDIVWNAPKVAGDYNIAFRVNEYRQGILISSTIRDMQILIRDKCENKVPDVAVIDRICVYAGETVQAIISVNDPDQGQKVLLTASGAPFISTKNRAQLSNMDEFLFPPYSAVFSWQTSCEDVSGQYYQVIFKVSDNGFSDTTGLTNLKVLQIKVVAPPPQNLNALPGEDHIKLQWDYPYACAFADNEYFQGFSVWRRIGSDNFYPDTCETGLNGKTYEKINYLSRENNGIHYFYEDFSIDKEINYCYRILPEFARKTQDGFPYNWVSGQTSSEVCSFLPSNAPLLTKVSVLSTEESNGTIDVRWKMTPPEVFDTLQYPGPYKLELFSSADGLFYSPVNGAVFLSQYYDIIKDTMFVHTGLNTLNSSYFYKLNLSTGNQNSFLGSSPVASSVFLKGEALTGRNKLVFESQVPWRNTKYHVYRKKDGENDFSKTGSTSFNEYLDDDVENGLVYCYYVVSEGNYPFMQDTDIVNNSQIICLEATDLEPVCAPALAVRNDCAEVSSWVPGEELYNYLTWEMDNCPERISDIIRFNIYFGNDPDQLELTGSAGSEEGFDFAHQGANGLKGCYAVVAVDLKGNEGEMSNIVCMENCPVYELPNVFTPNGDNVHDTFVPRFYRHIDQFSIQIFNQWGQLVFETNDPEINWDGTNRRGKALDTGVYFYVCSLRSGTSLNDQFTGFIHLFR